MGPRQVRIKVQRLVLVLQPCCCRKIPKTPPTIYSGTECSGYVTDVGSDVTDMQLATELCCPRLGRQAEEAVAHSSNVFKIPDSLPFNEAICFTNSYLILRPLNMATSASSERRSICSGPRSSGGKYSCCRNFKN